ncbi:hypothetical protein M9H77_12125 [Catharanthus roseus]|uniref:Uncharacterized protein n=1 Tax=Catharanthus roseus TaxID=4058 RepID=A0ACC0BGG9_CATRO|nr:hypothetical protein M9H77_12125 [Catharanthus roseus]
MDSTILFWNCRGATSDVFLNSLLNMLRRHNPTILLLVKTRTQEYRAGTILSNSQLDFVAISEVSGHVGGIWTFWSSTKINIQVASIFDQVIVSLVLKGQKVDWMLTPIYVSPHSVVRSGLWQCTMKLRQCNNVPWLLVGDMNQHLDNRHKKGGNKVHWRRSQELQDVLDERSILDIGFSGPKYTHRLTEGLQSQDTRKSRSLQRQYNTYLEPIQKGDRETFELKCHGLTRLVLQR